MDERQAGVEYGSEDATYMVSADVFLFAESSVRMVCLLDT